MAVLNDAVMFSLFSKKQARGVNENTPPANMPKIEDVDISSNLEKIAERPLWLDKINQQEKMEDAHINSKKEKKGRPLWLDMVISTRHLSCGFK